MKPAYAFQKKFDPVHGELRNTLQAFKAARYCSPVQLHELKPTDSLNTFPFMNGTLLSQLKKKLPAY